MCGLGPCEQTMQSSSGQIMSWILLTDSCLTQQDNGHHLCHSWIQQCPFSSFCTMFGNIMFWLGWSYGLEVVLGYWNIFIYFKYGWNKNSPFGLKWYQIVISQMKVMFKSQYDIQTLMNLSDWSISILRATTVDSEWGRNPAVRWRNSRYKTIKSN